MADSGAPGSDFPMKEAMRIVDLTMLRVPEAARLLVDSYAEHWPQAWPSYEDAVRRVEVALAGDGVNRIALNAADALVGWIGGEPGYHGRVWEIHPLAVRADHRGQGVGSMLVDDLEAIAAARGGLTLRVATDDPSGIGRDEGELYPDPVFALAAAMSRLRGHPFDFYRRLGFVPTGVVPDAHGRGRPDLLLARRIRKARRETRRSSRP